ncbi:MAG: hypothetical protein IJ598_03955 [Ruminococcus sp.]|nr:hypothetical protein [Ruminococcus sp.]
MKAPVTIRRWRPSKSLPQKLAFTFLTLLLGFGMEMLAQFLGSLSPKDIPSWLRFFDIVSFFSVLLPWAFAALVISLFSRTPIRAAINVLALFCGMLLGFLLYCGVFLHTVPNWDFLSSRLILTAVAPLIAAVCWYGRGVGTVAGFIAAFIIAYYFLQAFHFTPTFAGFGVNWTYSFVPLVLLAAAIGMLWRRPLQTLFSTLGGFALAYIYVLLPFSIPFI